MTKYKLTKKELSNHLKEQVQFLLWSSKSYDEGFTLEAKRLALHLRILLHDHDQGGSQSLFGQLDMKSMDFLNTAKPFDPDNLVSNFTLLSIKFHNPTGRRPWFTPLGTPNKLHEMARIPFEEWWEMPVLVAKSKGGDIFFSRKDIIIHTADTDGGAHVDSAIHKHYAALSKWNAINVFTIQNDIKKPIGNPIPPCLRQIAHEVLETLQGHCQMIFQDPYSYIPSDEPSSDNQGTGVPTPSELEFEMIN